MLQLNSDGSSRELQLDHNNTQVIVPRGVWQGAKTQGEWTLVSCWCAPAFEEELFHLGERSSLIAQYPEAHQLIKELTRID
jgi:predicted cupin superfamily sugar epimerase